MKPKITILTVGYGDGCLLGKETADALTGARQLVLRTEKNGISAWLKARSVPYTSLDSLYESAEDFDSLCRSIASFLWTKADDGPVTYAVTDVLTDGSVSALFRSRPENGEVEILPGTGLMDLCLPALRSAIPEADLRMVSAERFLRTRFDPDGSLLVVEMDSALLAGEIKLRLSERLPDDFDLLFMRDESSAKRIPLYELDRQPAYDHRTALFVPSCPPEKRGGFTRDDLPYALRLFRQQSPCKQGTPHAALKPTLLETAERCTSAMEANDSEALMESLGDLLFQCMLHAETAENFDEFTQNEMVDSLIRRIRPESRSNNA